MWTVPTWTKLLLPLVVVFAAGIVFPIPSDFGGNVGFRPPKEAFAIAWGLLLLLVGAAWAFGTSELRSPTQDVLFAALLLMLVGFSVIVASRKTQRGVVWMTYGAMGMALVTLASLDTLGRTLMAPLVAWLVFASQLAQANACASCEQLHN